MHPDRTGGSRAWRPVYCRQSALKIFSIAISLTQKQLTAGKEDSAGSSALAASTPLAYI